MTAVALRDQTGAREHLATVALCAVIALRRPRWRGASTLRPAEVAAVSWVLRQVVQAYRSLPGAHASVESHSVSSALLSSPALTNEDRSALVAAGAPTELVGRVERRLAELEAAHQSLAYYPHRRLLEEMLLRLAAAAALSEGERGAGSLLVGAHQTLLDLGLSARARESRTWHRQGFPRRRGDSR